MVMAVIRRLLPWVGVFGLVAICHADPEIMVHEGDVAEVGEVTLTWHANHALRGDKESDDGTWPAHRLTSVAAEIATGFAPGWEAGLHLPVIRAGVDSETSRAGDWGASALMFLLKHIHHVDDERYFGFSAEYDLNAQRFDSAPRTLELRGILGFDGKHFRLAINPLLNWRFGLPGTDRRPDFEVDLKLLHKLTSSFVWGAELYSDWGKLADPKPGRGERTIYLVGEATTAYGVLHLGLGHGFKDAPQQTIVKAMWEIDF